MVSTEFISNCISGDEDAVQVLVRTYQRNVFQLALSVLDHTDAPIEETINQAEIATRETFIAVLNRLARYREETPFMVWHNRIAVQVSQKRFRIWQRERRLNRFLGRLRIKTNGKSAAEGLPTQRAETNPVRSKEEEAIWQTVRRLNDRLRLPIVLRYYHDLPVNDIAGILGLSDGAVQARLDQAREKIAQIDGEEKQPDN